MRAVLQILLVVASLAVLVLPTANMVLPLFEQTPLWGVTAEVPRPKLSLAGLRDETFQGGFTRWFDHAYGARPTLTRLDNSLIYHLFDEARPDQAVRVGKDGVLFVHEHLWFWNNRRTFDFVREAKRVRVAQDALRARGVELVYITVPTKTALWADAIPSRWTTVSAEERTSDRRLARAFPEELARAGARFVDGRRLLEDLARADRQAVYARGARHSARPSVCLLVEDAVRQARPFLTGKAVPPFDCRYELTKTVPPRSDDDDLYRLLNVWPTESPTLATHMLDIPASPGSLDEERPDALVVGSSFGWHVSRELIRNRAARDVKFYYYFSRVLEFPSETSRALPLGSAEFGDLLTSRQLVLYVAPEEYFADDKNPFWVTLIQRYAPDTPENKELAQ